MPKFRRNTRLARFSNYKIGGPARYFFEPRDEREVVWAVGAARARRLPMFVLGGGTNLLLPDRGFAGLVIRPNLLSIERNGTALTAGAGVPMADLLNRAASHSLAGLEWAGGLPGTLGGAIRGNAGCFGGEIKDVIRSVRSLDTRTMKIVERRSEECGFGYRSSVFKKDGADEIVLRATIRLKKGRKTEIAKAIREKIEYRRKNHPLEYPNIGSMFKNVPLASIHQRTGAEYRRALRGGTLSFRGSTFTVKTDPFPVISAAKLISESGLRGAGFGGAMISEKHPNFIVNTGGARASDVLRLVKLVKARVRRKFGIQLEEEVQIVPS